MVVIATYGMQPVDQVDPPALILLAHRTIEREVSGLPNEAVTGKVPSQPVFVTIERGGKLLGCRGSLVPRQVSLEREVQEDALAACAHDPRNRPLTRSDLKGMLVTVTVVSRLIPVEGVSGLQPADGLVLESGNATGVVLPWEGKDPDVRLKWAYKKAGVDRSQPVSLFVLKGERYRG
jgi:AMMECR1 domain-containing protein